MRNSTLCYLQKSGCYLMLHRVKKTGDMNRGKYLGIGGGFEDGESPEDCILRETREETGLTLNSWAYRGIVTFVSDRWETEYMHLFTSDDFTGTLRECDEGDLVWIPIEQVPNLPIWQGDRLFLDLLDTDRPFFSLKLRYEGESLCEAVLDGKKIFPAENGGE